LDLNQGIWLDDLDNFLGKCWIPACAGMTKKTDGNHKKEMGMTKAFCLQGFYEQENGVKLSKLYITFFLNGEL